MPENGKAYSEECRALGKNSMNTLEHQKILFVRSYHT